MVIDNAQIIEALKIIAWFIKAPTLPADESASFVKLLRLNQIIKDSETRMKEDGEGVEVHTDKKKFYVIWYAPNPFYEKGENDSYQPPEHYIREFDFLADAVLYYWQHKERGIESVRLVKDISNEPINEVWEEAQP